MRPLTVLNSLIARKWLVYFMILFFSGVCLTGVLIALSIIDWRTFRLPNTLTLPLIALGLGVSYIHGELVSALIGALLGYCGLVALELAYKHTRGVDGIGRGDAKLLAAGGAWCGWFGLPFIILIASAAGLIHVGLMSVHNKNTETASPKHIPFGPYLSLGIFLTWLAIYVIA